MSKVCPSVEELKYVNTDTTCPIEGCGRRFARSSGIAMHLRNTHRLLPNPASSASSKLKHSEYHCPVEECIYNINTPYFFSSLQNLKQHYLVSHGEKTFVCQKCSKSFSMQRQLHRHLKHCGVLFKCLVCSCPYSTPEAMLTHCSRNGHNPPPPECVAPKKQKKMRSKGAGIVVINVINVTPEICCQPSTSVPDSIQSVSTTPCTEVPSNLACRTPNTPKSSQQLPNSSENPHYRSAILESPTTYLNTSKILLPRMVSEPVLDCQDVLTPSVVASSVEMTRSNMLTPTRDEVLPEVSLCSKSNSPSCVPQTNCALGSRINFQKENVDNTIGQSSSDDISSISYVPSHLPSPCLVGAVPDQTHTFPSHESLSDSLLSTTRDSLVTDIATQTNKDFLSSVSTNDASTSTKNLLNDSPERFPLLNLVDDEYIPAINSRSECETQTTLPESDVTTEMVREERFSQTPQSLNVVLSSIHCETQTFVNFVASEAKNTQTVETGWDNVGTNIETQTSCWDSLLEDMETQTPCWDDKDIWQAFPDSFIDETFATTAECLYDIPEQSSMESSVESSMETSAEKKRISVSPLYTSTHVLLKSQDEDEAAKLFFNSNSVETQTSLSDTSLHYMTLNSDTHTQTHISSNTTHTQTKFPISNIQTQTGLMYEENIFNQFGFGLNNWD